MTETPVSPSLIARVSQAARYVISGVAPDTWFGPLQPLAPIAPADVAGRRFDYPTGYNLNYTPRISESVSFEDLRALADNCDILRSVIETRKDQIEGLEWNIRVTPSSTDAKRIAVPNDDQKRRINQIIAFLHCPDKEHGFHQWLRQILEDMFVIDAVTLYKRRTRAGGLYALEVVDGATIKILIDENGRSPAPPDPAYQQVLKGVPAADFTREELIYLTHNPRSHKVYGYSHVEQVLLTVNILIRRALHQLEYYRDGSQPDAFMGLPKEWNQDQIAQFQKHFDSLLSGSLSMRRRVRFMPGDFKYQETKAPPLKDSYDEFLARIICFVFSVSPEPFVAQVNRATAQSSHNRAIDEGLAPLMRFVRSLINRIIKQDLDSPDLEFVWKDTREQDPKEAASIDVAYVGAGIMTVDEVRANMGLLPLAPGAKPVVKHNPYHLGPGPGGGQFTTEALDGSSIGSPKGSYKPSAPVDLKHPPVAVRATTDNASPKTDSSKDKPYNPSDDAIDSDPIGGILIPAAIIATLPQGIVAEIMAAGARIISAARNGNNIRELLSSEEGSIPGGGSFGDAEVASAGEEYVPQTPRAQGGSANTMPVSNTGNNSAEANSLREDSLYPTEVTSINDTEIIVDRANNLIGNDGVVATSRSIAEDAAKKFIGNNPSPIFDRASPEGDIVGEISADGTKIVRYTSVNKPDPYINLENKITRGNLHVRWLK